jgi:hypothetical protein
MGALLVIQINEYLFGIIIFSFIGIIVWVYIRGLNSQDKITDAVNMQNITLKSIETDLTSRQQMCHERHQGINDWLNEHEETINKHGERLTRVEATLKIKE